MRVLLDTSAWLAHLFAEPGVEQVNDLFDDPQNEVNITSLSIVEVYGRLKAMGRQAHWAEVWQTYSGLFDKVLAVDVEIAQQAVVLREATPHRLPAIDALIAATAVAHHLSLVHRDPHFAAIPSTLLSQITLPEKS